jgi:hypothetical protein
MILLMLTLIGIIIYLYLLVNSCLIKLDQLKVLIALGLSAFHRKASHVVIVFSLVEYDLCSCLLLIILYLHNPSAALKDALKTFLESSTSSRERATSQLHVETSFFAGSHCFWFVF